MLKVRWSFFSILVHFVTFGSTQTNVIGLQGLYNCVVLKQKTRIVLVLPCLNVGVERNKERSFTGCFLFFFY
jgi:hypothetical protein